MEMRPIPRNGFAEWKKQSPWVPGGTGVRDRNKTVRDLLEQSSVCSAILFDTLGMETRPPAS